MPTLRPEPVIPQLWLQEQVFSAKYNIGPNLALQNHAINYSVKTNENPSPQPSTPVQQLPDSSRSYHTIMTFDQQSQTDSCLLDDFPNGRMGLVKMQEDLNNMNHMLRELHKSMYNLQTTISAWTNETMENNPPMMSMCLSNRETPDTPLNDSNHSIKMENMEIENISLVSRKEETRQSLVGTRVSKRKESHEIVNGNSIDEWSEMVPIGSGKTLVPRQIYSQIKWSSYTMATRKLLMAVFPRRTLATHSLTGKSSPAFMNKPAKLCLDPKKVSDIVMTVTAKCGVTESLVRSAITTKCADENKMYRMRIIKKEKKAKKPQSVTEVTSNNQENIPPGGSSSIQVDDVEEN